MEKKQNIQNKKEKSSFLKSSRTLVESKMKNKTKAPDSTDTGTDGNDNHFDNVQ